VVVKQADAMKSKGTSIGILSVVVAVGAILFPLAIGHDTENQTLLKLLIAYEFIAPLLGATLGIIACCMSKRGAIFGTVAIVLCLLVLIILMSSTFGQQDSQEDAEIKAILANGQFFSPEVQVRDVRYVIDELSSRGGGWLAVSENANVRFGTDLGLMVAPRPGTTEIFIRLPPVGLRLSRIESLRTLRDEISLNENQGRYYLILRFERR
jgi:hypothetical protein